MGMASLKISLPKAVKEFVDSQAREGGYDTPGDYVRDLLVRERERKAEEQLERLLLSGLRSGDGMEASAGFWERKRRELSRGHSTSTR